MLIDAGPLVALIDRRDPDHDICVRALATRTDPLHTTWPAFGEAMHLLGRRAGWPGQDHLWGLIDDAGLRIVAIADEHAAELARLMRRYRDAPMDLADATLVVAASLTGEREILTLDAHFHAYRLSGGRHFAVLP